MDQLMNDIDIGSCQKLSSDWLITMAGLSHAKGLFGEIISSRAEKAATKKVTIILEDDETPKASFILGNSTIETGKAALILWNSTI